MSLYHANRQWASRPDDERFETLQDMRDFCAGVRDASAAAKARPSDLSFAASGGEVLVRGEKTGTVARMSTHAFGQVSALLKAPADFVRGLSTDTAAQVLNEKLGQRDEDNELGLLFHRNGSLMLRGITGPKYARVWDVEIADRLLAAQERGWRVPPAWPARPDQAGTRAATEADVAAMRRFDGTSGTLVKPGDTIAPAGIYASVHDVWCFMVDPTRRIEDGSEGGLMRGFFVSNSECGGIALEVTTFLLRAACGNHNIIGGKDARTSRVIHVSAAREKWVDAMRTVQALADRPASEDEALIAAAQSRRVADDDEAAADFFKAKKLGTRALALSAIGDAREHEPALDPLSFYGMAQGLTRVSQRERHGDRRGAIDAAAGKLMEMAF